MAGRFGPCCSSVVWVLKLGSDGNVEWEKTYSNGVYESARSIEQTPDGGYIVGALTSTFGFGDLWLIKLDSDGKVEWQKVYLGGSEFPSGVHQTTDGGLIAVGVSSFTLDAWILKLDSDGNIDQCTSPIIQDTNAVETDTVSPSLDTSADVADSTSTIVDFTTAAQEHTTLITDLCALSPSSSLNLFEGTNSSDLSLDLGQEARAVANTTDPYVRQVNFTWNNPNG